MRAILDTNVIIRHLTADVHDLAARATRFLAGRDELVLPDVIVAEVVYVLESFYGRSRAEVAGLLRPLLSLPALVIGDPGLLLRAIEVYEAHRLDFADAYVVASAERHTGGVVASFDKGIDRVGTVERLEPA